MIQLSEEQHQILELFKTTRDNLFIMGKAGVGKSVILREMRDYMECTEMQGYVVAPTGVAAMNVGGMTIHKLLGIINGILESPKERKAIDTIIIDEVSMVRADLMDQLDMALRRYNRDSNVFGATRIVVIGDLAQMPPVIVGDAEKDFLKDTYLSEYFFSSSAYSEATWKILELTKIFRQSDGDYIKLLNMIRQGENVKTVEALNQLFIVDEPEGIVLCTTNKDAVALNYEELAKISSTAYMFTADVEGELEEKDFPTEYSLVLKEQARVMIIKNLYDDEGKLELVNGDWGTITQIDTNPLSEPPTQSIYILCDRTKVEHRIWPSKWIKEGLRYDKELGELNKVKIGSFTQFPIRLAWAITIHKSQGATISKYTIDLRNPMFAVGQLYVALSRGITADSVKILGRVRPRDVKISKIVTAFLKDYTSGVGIKKGSKYDKSVVKDKFVDISNRVNTIEAI